MLGMQALKKLRARLGIPSHICPSYHLILEDGMPGPLSTTGIKWGKWHYQLKPDALCFQVWSILTKVFLAVAELPFLKPCLIPR